ncbi:MAG: tryptophan synthase subunit alpha [Herpetosiphonaceae bacterium]|nr:tryptophan synthase subunit alpha [Herpetosiphonaceae bacterium]
MSRIAAVFQRLAQTDRQALIMYLTVGYPTMHAAREIVPALVAAGADMIELGVPFSDPLADGVTIQKATQQALANKVNVRHCLQTVRQLRADGLQVPLIFMGYYNPLLQYGLEAFARDAAEAGADGFIVPDLPPEEAGALHDACRVYDLDLIFFVAPTSTDARIKQVAALASGFIYCVSLTGVTGARSTIAANLPHFLARVRNETKVPLAVGFGVSQPSQAQEVASVADGVIVGSALINLVEQSVEHGLDEVKAFTHSLRTAMDQPKSRDVGSS